MADAAAAVGITIFVFYKNPKPAVVPSTLQARAYAFHELQEGVVAAVMPLGFSRADIHAGDVFVQPKPVGKKPSRPAGDGLFEGDVSLSPEGGISKCILLNLGDAPAGVSAGAAGAAGGGGGAPAGADILQRLAHLELESSRQHAESLRQQAHRLAIRPTPAPVASPSRSSEASGAASASSSQKAAHAAFKAAAQQKQFELKLAALRYYGLDVGVYDASSAGHWKARTMLDLDSSPVDFKDCTLAHVFPKSLDDDVVEELGLVLHLPPHFMDEPRAFLLLPKVVELAFDREAVLLLPSVGGQIVVKPWHVDRMTEDEGSRLQPYLHKELSWPKKREASPHLPFMRMLAHRMLFASVKEPDGLDDAAHEKLGLEQQQAMVASASSSGNKGAATLFGNFRR